MRLSVISFVGNLLQVENDFSLVILQHSSAFSEAFPLLFVLLKMSKKLFVSLLSLIHFFHDPNEITLLSVALSPSIQSVKSLADFTKSFSAVVNTRRSLLLFLWQLLEGCG